MVSFFPMPFPDEVVYDIFGRYDSTVKNNSLYKTMIDLTNSESTNLNFAYANNLDELCNMYPLNLLYNSSYFINHHTILPLYKSFTPEQKYDEFFDYLRGKGNNPRFIPQIDKHAFKYCEHCIASDKQKYGVSYIHRLHQVDGYIVCHVHNTPLKILEVDRIKSKRFYTIDTILFQLQLTGETNVDKNLLQLSVGFSSLLENFDRLPSYELTEEKLKTRMYEIGYLSKNGKMHYKKLRSDLIARYSRETLSQLNAYYEETDKRDWLHFIFSKVQSPVRYLLLINLIFANIESFLSYKAVDITNNQLICSNEINDNEKNNYNQLLAQKYMNTLLALPKTLSRYQIKELYCKEYSFLFRYCKKWLHDYLPPPLPRAYYKKKTMINWKKKDDELYEKILKIIDDVLSEDIKTRITSQLVKDKLNYNFMSVINNIPRTKELCENAFESIETYHKRKIIIVYKEILSEGLIPTKTSLLQRASIGKRQYHNYDGIISELLVTT
jgi:hypothetical protein